MTDNAKGTEGCEHDWLLPDHTRRGSEAGLMFKPSPMFRLNADLDIAWCSKCGTVYRYGRLHVPAAHNASDPTAQARAQAAEQLARDWKEADDANWDSLRRIATDKRDAEDALDIAVKALREVRSLCVPMNTDWGHSGVVAVVDEALTAIASKHPGSEQKGG